MAKKSVKKIEIELVRSRFGRKPNQQATLKALGLRKINQKVQKEANPAILGMVNTVSHLVKVEEVK
ncbi:MAG: 50S ribosomal protein L30 [Spirochaetales bacterium]|nr:50S ribosomal protein L30 [Spirochaetales bacterium]